MHVAVTGASGFIGRALCRRLAEAGHATRALVRAPLAELDAMPNVEQRTVGDLEILADWPRALDGVQAIVHLAAHAHGRGAPGGLRRLNVDAPAAAARAAQACAAHFVFISSAKVHGEESAAPLSEASPLAPRDAYGVSKADAEAALRRIPGLRLTVLRPPLVYGPGVKANFHALLAAIARGIPLPLAAIANRRSIVYVDNLADAIVACLTRAQAVGRSYLLSDGAPVSTPQLCRDIGSALGRPARLFAFPARLLPAKSLTRSLELDDGAIRRELEWQPPYTLHAGLAATAQWYRRR